MAKRTRQQVGRFSKRKGSSYERVIGKKWRDFWGTDEKTFRRTPMSGAFDRDNMAGDLIVPDDFPFWIEAKNRQSWSWEMFFQDSHASGQLMAFWDEIVKEAENSPKNREPLMVFTRNQAPDYLMLSYKIASGLERDHKELSFIDHWNGVSFIELDIFLNVVDREYFRECLRDEMQLAFYKGAP